VDRTRELALFHRALTGETNKRILLILEPPEQGKTCFLQRLVYECEDQRPPVPLVLLDFDRRRSGLTDFLSVARGFRRCLGEECTGAIRACEDAIYCRSPLVSMHTGEGDAGVDWGKRGRFAEAGISDVTGRDRVQIGSVSEAPPTAGQIARWRAEMGRALCRDLAGLADSHRRVVLLVDAFEHISDETCSWLDRWLFDPLRRELRHVLVVVAGRPQCRSSFARPRLWGSLMATIDHFTPLSDDDIEAHYYQRGIPVSAWFRILRS